MSWIAKAWRAFWRACLGLIRFVIMEEMQHQVLRRLAARPEGVRYCDLQRELDIDQESMQELAEMMASSGVVSCESGVWTITECGRQVLLSWEKIHQDSVLLQSPWS